MKLTNVSIKNQTMNAEDLKVTLTFSDPELTLTLDEKDLTNLKNDLQFVYDQFMKFKGE